MPVPHHPTARGVIKHTIIGFDVAMQLMLLEVIQCGSPDTVDDAFGFARGA